MDIDIVCSKANFFYKIANIASILDKFDLYANHIDSYIKTIKRHIGNIEYRVNEYEKSLSEIKEEHEEQEGEEEEELSRFYGYEQGIYEANHDFIHYIHGDFVQLLRLISYLLTHAFDINHDDNITNI